ncbi:FtsX-like permease family protein [Candidatus Pacearchaeota archaeon]|nr:FtsX-like permease family protein [Candidatus Pacearchaeota archaeon]MBD3283195.1 FtsX-like permease family protein [Candidatus Pacearchaeota archaeon]
MIEDYFKIAIKSLKERKTRSFLTVLGIFLGILTIFVLLSLSLGLRDFVNEQFEMLGSDKFFIQPKGQAGAPGTGGAVELTLDDVNVIEKVDGIDDVSYFAVGNAKIEFKEESRYYFVIGMPTEDAEKINLIFESTGIGIDEGRMLKKGDSKKILIGYNYRYKNLYEEPLRVRNKIELNDVEFEVVGILEAVGNPGDDQQVYISMEDFKELFDSDDRVDYIMIQVKSEDELKEISEEVEKKLMKYRDVDEKTVDFTVLTPEELLEIFDDVLNGITGFLFIIAFISAVVGGIGIANTMYTSILERKKDIGTMKAIGAKNSDILLIFVIESGILGLIGGILGVVVGIGVGKIIEYIITIYLGSNLLRASLNPILILACLGFGFIVGIISGFFPSYQASKLRPVDALRYE